MDFLWVDNCMKRDPVDIQHIESIEVKPLFCTKTKVFPLHFQQEANNIIKDMLEWGILGKAEGYTAWCSSATFVPIPSGGLCLVTDFCYLNKQINCPIHPFQTTTNI